MLLFFSPTDPVKLHPEFALNKVPASHVDSLILTEAQIFYFLVEVFTKETPCAKIFSAGVLKTSVTTEPGPECTQPKVKLSLRVFMK